MPTSSAAAARIPVILDTDIGDDIDDTWALGLLLKSPRFDVRLITTTNGQAEYRARLISKILTIAKRTDIPIGLGPGQSDGPEREKDWIDGWRLDDFRGAIHRDGAAAIVETINKSDPRHPITVIAIGPLQTLAAALAMDPSIAGRANLVGMQGSVLRGYAGSIPPQPEYNVKTCIASARKVLAAHWRSITITPLDTCGDAAMKLDGPRFDRLRKSDDPLAGAILQSYAVWCGKEAAELGESTILFDTVAIYLADPTDRSTINLQPLNIAVTDTGMTIVSQGELGRPMQVATSWNSLEGFKDVLLERLVGAGEVGSK